MEEQNQQFDAKVIKMNYRLFITGQLIIIVSSIYFIQYYLGIWEPGDYFSFTFLFLIFVGWIIAIPSAITYKRKSKKNIGIFRWIVIFLPIIITVWVLMTALNGIY